MARQKILVMDDAPDHRDIMCRMLRATGYSVVEADPCPEALDQAEVDTPDLILIALTLPGQRGWETARQIRTRVPLSNVPVLGTTVFGTLISSRRARSIGCADRLEKPLNLDELLYYVKNLLPSRHP